MEKKNVNIKIAADVEEAKKSINSIAEHLNKFAKKAQQTQKPLKILLDSFNSISFAFTNVKKIVSAVTDTINDMTAVDDPPKIAGRYTKDSSSARGFSAVRFLLPLVAAGLPESAFCRREM